jgi:hypothetical protein
MEPEWMMAEFDWGSQIGVAGKWPDGTRHAMSASLLAAGAALPDVMTERPYVAHNKEAVVDALKVGLRAWYAERAGNG